MTTRRPVIAERAHLDPSLQAGAMNTLTDLTTDTLTYVDLTWQAKRIEHRIRFGHPVANLRLDRHRRRIAFAPATRRGSNGGEWHHDTPRLFHPRCVVRGREPGLDDRRETAAALHLESHAKRSARSLQRAAAGAPARHHAGRGDAAGTPGDHSLRRWLFAARRAAPQTHLRPSRADHLSSRRANHC